MVKPRTALNNTVSSLTAWYKNVEALIQPSSYNPNLIFNMDETMISAGSNKCKVLHLKGSPPFRIEDTQEEGLHVTLALCINAAGKLLKPLAILEVSSIPFNFDEILDDFHWSYQPSGWMTKEIFKSWAREVFLPAVELLRIEHNLPNEPALLYVDGHSSRHNIELLEFLKDKNIHVVLIPPHSSHILQPLDCGVNGAFKQMYTHGRKSSLLLPLPERRLKLLKEASIALQQAATTFKVRESFAKSGLYPWNLQVPLASEHVFQALPPQLAEVTRKRRRSAIKGYGGVMTSKAALNELKKETERMQAPKKKRGRPKKVSRTFEENMSPQSDLARSNE